MNREPIDFSATSPSIANGAPSESTTAAEAETRAKLAEQIVQRVEATAQLFHDQKDVSYAIVSVGDRRVPLKVSSRHMRTWLARTMRKEIGRTIGKSAIDEAVTALDGIARFDGPRRETHHRIAAHEDALYLDLGDDGGTYVRVTEKGWTVHTGSAPVLFLRPDSMLPLPRPVRGGNLEELRTFVNAPDDDALLLVAGWLLSALRPDRPCPILALYGEQGTAKSTASRVVRRLIDPSRGSIRSAMRNSDDLFIAALNSRVVALDNLSGVQPWLSDGLCQLATGGGLSKRTLYTDDEETVLEVMRPIVVNGIDDIANRPDFAERCIILTLQPIAKRRDEASFWRDFEDAAPRLLGVLLDGIASALRHVSRVEIAELPRMADHARWTTAAEEGLGLEPGAMLGAYRRNQVAVVDLALDASPVASALRRLLDQPSHAGRWSGEPSQLLDALGEIATDAVKRLPVWPKTPNTLSKSLRRSATFLRSSGIAIDFNGHEGRDDAKRRIWRIARTHGAPLAPVPAPTSGDVGDAGDASHVVAEANVVLRGDSSRKTGGSNE